jgi:hypothetical protein
VAELVKLHILITKASVIFGAPRVSPWNADGFYLDPDGVPVMATGTLCPSSPIMLDIRPKPL